MAPQGARASTSTVRIRFTYIEETFQCLPEHMSILRPLSELWAHEHTEAIVRTMSILMPLTELWAHEHTEAIDKIWAHEHTEATARPMRTWAYWGHCQNYEHMSILRPLTELWAHEHTEVIDRTMSTWAYWGHWQKNEHMSMLSPLTELNPVRRSTLSPWMTWHLMGPGYPQSQWGSNSHV